MKAGSDGSGAVVSVSTSIQGADLPVQVAVPAAQEPVPVP
jgi:hypothetical protein